MSNLLSLINLSKNFGSLQVIDNFNMHLDDGDGDTFHHDHSILIVDILRMMMPAIIHKRILGFFDAGLRGTSSMDLNSLKPLPQVPGKIAWSLRWE